MTRISITQESLLCYWVIFFFVCVSRMIRTCKRKITRASECESDMNKSLGSVKQQPRSLRTAATLFGEPKDALQRRARRIGDCEEQWLYKKNGWATENACFPTFQVSRSFLPYLTRKIIQAGRRAALFQRQHPTRQSWCWREQPKTSLSLPPPPPFYKEKENRKKFLKADRRVISDPSKKRAMSTRSADRAMHTTNRLALPGMQRTLEVEPNSPAFSMNRVHAMHGVGLVRVRWSLQSAFQVFFFIILSVSMYSTTLSQFAP